MFNVFEFNRMIIKYTYSINSYWGFLGAFDSGDDASITAAFPAHVLGATKL
jgi:hypothetical protein